MLTRLPTHRQQTISAGFDPLIGAAEQCYRHRRAPLPRVQPGTHPGTLPRAAAAGWMGASAGSLQPPRPLSEYLCAASAADLPRAAILNTMAAVESVTWRKCLLAKSRHCMSGLK